MSKILFFIILYPVFLSAQSGKVYDKLSLSSKVLKSDRNYAVYLPPDYETSQRSYPVLYLLHGAGDDQTGWIQFGEVLRITDNAIKEGLATPMIIIMPDANTGRRGYFNDAKGDWNYEEFFFSEFMPFIEKTYRVKNEKRFRAIAGLSMGGGGSFIYALRRPDLFSAACPLSAYLGPLNDEEGLRMLQRTVPKLPESDKLKYIRQHSVLALLENMADSVKKSVRWYIDCGDDDFLYEGNSLAHILMKKKNIPHEFRIREGAHTWTYWRESLPEVLRFVSDGFHQH